MICSMTGFGHFEKDFEGTKIIKLEQNYRCTGNILKVANEVIKNNTDKYDKKLWTENTNGEFIQEEMNMMKLHLLLIK